MSRIPPGYHIRATSRAPRVNTVTHADSRTKPLSEVDHANFIGQQIYHGQYSTRTAPNKYRPHNGRLVRYRLYKDDTTAIHPVALQRQKVRGATIREIVKGLMLDDGRLIDSAMEAALIETLYQFASDETAAWARDNRSKLAAFLSGAPIGSISRIISMMKNHDGDVERQHWTNWLNWIDREVDRGPTEDETEAQAARRLRNTWVRCATKARKYTRRANETKDHPSADLPDAPLLTVLNRRTGAALTAREIALVATTD